MLQRIETLSRVIEQEFHVRLQIGVGIHYGPVIVGKVGPSDDLRFGLVGDTVNIASRLEGQAKALGVPLLASAAVVEQLTDRERIEIGEAAAISLKGVQGALAVHSIQKNVPEA